MSALLTDFTSNREFEVVEFHQPKINIANDVSSSVEVKSGGYGSVRGVMFSAPAFSTTTVTFTINTTSFSKDDIDSIQALVKGMLSASNYEKYQEECSKSASASYSFFSGPSASASASQTESTMRGYGLTEAQQTELINKMFTILPKPSTYTYQSVITNTSNEQVSGQMMLYNFTGVITSNNVQSQKPLVGNPVALGPDGQPMPITSSFG